MLFLLPLLLYVFELVCVCVCVCEHTHLRAETYLQGDEALHVRWGDLCAREMA